jgi:hypothetical protein
MIEKRATSRLNQGGTSPSEHECLTVFNVSITERWANLGSYEMLTRNLNETHQMVFWVNLIHELQF